MAWSLSNVYTTDSYLSSPATIGGCDGKSIHLQIWGAAVYYQRSASHHSGWETEVLLAPGVYILHRRIYAIQFRSAVPGIPALISAEVIGNHD